MADTPANTPLWPLAWTLDTLRGADPVLGLAAVTLVAVVAANALHHLLRLPRACGYMLVGALASPALLNLLQRTDLDPWKPLIDLAIGALVFELGSRLRPRWLVDNPWFAASALAEGLLAALAVGWALVVLGAPPAATVVAAAVAASTSPLITMAVVHEARPRGQVSERLLMMSAVNSVLAVLAIKLWPVVAAAGASDLWAAAPSALRVVCGSFLLGVACGWLLDHTSRLVGDGTTMPVLQIALIILATLLAVAWGLSPLLALLVAGMTARARMGHRLTVEPHLGSAGAALTVLLFICLGMLFQLGDLARLWPWVLAIVLARLAGKALAVLLLARPSGLGWRQAVALVVALQPMSSLAVLLVASSFGWPDAADAAETTVMQALLAATTLMQLAGPLWVQWGLQGLARECHAPPAPPPRPAPAAQPGEREASHVA